MTWDPTRDPIMLRASIGILENAIKKLSKGSKADRQWLIDKDVAGQLVRRRATLAEVYAERSAARSAAAAADAAAAVAAAAAAADAAAVPAVAPDSAPSGPTAPASAAVATPPGYGLPEE
jgi:hypothetical protein